ncbi:hypothetical protein O1611_g4033 [Lasiodiplodia mahajangana]|uniref:Uncharacterized protein n=1 Tax=Lasiodiplodia mahajangana TaxID=1108764 RepID=A0ACC2JQ43_9PEZI|nr:hypothetical protein O1611_g4033 [Lasiodiplodia mahajangana]
MEALAALGLASNIVQFLEFTWRLTSAVGEIKNSASSATERTLDLNKIYGKLDTFCSNLLAPPKPVTSNDEAKRVQILFSNPESDLQRQVIIQSHTKDLQTLASDCAVLCQQLLAVTRTLQAKAGSKHKLGSFKAALKTLWNEKKISDLEERLKRYQKAIALHFLPLIEEHTAYTNSLLQRLRHESALLRIEHASQFDQISERLNELKQNLSATVPQIIVRDSKDHAPVDTATELLEAEGSYTTRNLTKEDIDSIVQSVSNLSFNDRDIATLAREQAFLRGLDFTSRRYRYEDIPEAYKQTFGWIFDPSKQQEEEEEGVSGHGSRLLQWLRHGNGTFWVSGKAGSGKSTLMKYIVNHDETRKSLEAWAGTKKLIIAAHYFWNAGSMMQKSQRGLYRSLLYDFLRVCPEQIPHVCSARWAATKIGLTLPPTDNWTVEELLEAIQNLIRMPDSPIRLCVFVDGVDEYEGDHFEFCQLMKELFCSPTVKCLMSSRPWNVFKDAFGVDQTPRLYLHQLTRRDILVYAQSRLAEHPRWSVTYLPKEQMESIIDTITEKAQGVFLWVHLVGKSLRDGLTDGDTIRDLQLRLDSLPSDLELFFKHIINQVDSLYHKKMARLLLTAVNARQSLDLEFYRTQEYEDEDGDYALNKPVEKDATDEKAWVNEACQRRINARCGGLLEIRKGRVEFLHRSVHDFLLTREMNDYLHLESGPEFKVNLSTLKMYVYSFRCWVQNGHVALAEDQDIWRNGLAYANEALEEDVEAALALLDAVGDLYEQTPANMDSAFLNVSPDFIFQSEILRAGVDRYVDIRLKESSDFFQSVFESPLCTAMEESPWSQGHVKIIKQLLESGSDPNADSWEVPWAVFLRLTCAQKSDHNFTEALQNSLFSDFLKNGAKRDIKLDLGQHGRVSVCDIDRYGGSRLPCTHFIAALFRYNNSHRFPGECAHALEDFCCGSAEHIKLQIAEALPLLQQGLSELGINASEPGRLRFFAQIIQKLILKWQQDTPELKALIPSILGAFPAATGATLSDMINHPGRASPYQSRRSPMKRPHDMAEAEASPSRKSSRLRY